MAHGWLFALLFTTLAVSAQAMGTCEVTLSQGGGMYKAGEKDSKYYSEGYAVFAKRTNFREKIETRVNAHIAANPTIFNKSTLRIMDIGCGNGEMTRRYLQALRRALPNVSIVIDLIEPANDALETAKTKIQELDPAATIYAHNGKLEDFMQAERFKTGSFDWIIASHVFYHVDPNLIKDAVTRLSDDGTMMITMGAPGHPLREPEAIRKIAKHGDAGLVTRVLDESSFGKNYIYHSEAVRTDLNLNGLWSREKGFTPDGVAFFSFTYNHDLDKLPDSARTALDSLLERVSTKEDGFVHPEHNIIWVCRQNKCGP